MNRDIQIVLDGQIVAPLQMWMTFPICSAQVDGVTVEVLHTGRDLLLWLSPDSTETKRYSVRFDLREFIGWMLDNQDHIVSETNKGDALLARLTEAGGNVTHADWEEANNEQVASL